MITIKESWKGKLFRDSFQLPNGTSLSKCSRVINLRTEMLKKRIRLVAPELESAVTIFSANSIRKAISSGEKISGDLFLNFVAHFLLDFEAPHTKGEDDIINCYLHCKYDHKEFIRFISAFEPKSLLDSPVFDETLEIIDVITKHNNHPFGHIPKNELLKKINPTKTNSIGTKHLSLKNKTSIPLVYKVAGVFIFISIIITIFLGLFSKQNCSSEQKDEARLFPSDCDFKVLVLPFRHHRKYTYGGSLDIGKEFTILLNNKADSLQFNLCAYYDSTINPEILSEEKVAMIFHKTGADKIIYGLHNELRFLPNTQIDSINVGYYVNNAKSVGFPAHSFSGFFRTSATDFINGNVLYHVSLDDIIELNEIEYLVRQFLLNRPRIDVYPLTESSRLKVQNIFERLEYYIIQKDTQNAYLWNLLGMMHLSSAIRYYNLRVKSGNGNLTKQLQKNITEGRASFWKALHFSKSNEKLFHSLDIYMILGHFNGYGPIKKSDPKLFDFLDKKYGKGCEYYYAVLIDFTFRESLDLYGHDITSRYLNDTVKVALNFMEELNLLCHKKYPKTQNRYMYALAEAYYFIEDYEKSLVFCDRILLDDPNSWGVRILKCRLLIALKKNTAAPYLERLVKETDAPEKYIPMELNYQYFINLLAKERIAEAKKFINRLNYEFPHRYPEWRQWIDYFGRDIDIVDLRNGGYNLPVPPEYSTSTK